MIREDSSEAVRLNKHLALVLGTSRRQADELITSGVVQVNGVKADLGRRVTTNDIITVKGEDVINTTRHVYLALHKPVGYVSSRRAQGSNPTLYDLLPQKYHSLKPVGRLDKDTSGLILLTNDGDFAFTHTHPKFYKTKIYECALDKDLAPLHQQMISDYGVRLEDGVSKFMIEKIELPSTSTPAWVTARGVGPASDKSQLLRITMTEGRNRQIRRTFTALGYRVTRLQRTHFGDYSLGDISPGEYRVINIP